MTFSRREWRPLLASALLGASVLPAAAFDVETIGSFHIGGAPVKIDGQPVREVKSGNTVSKVDINGDFHTGQMYVQYVKLKDPAAKYPLLLWHTGGVSGASWETKPDGKPGWMEFFLKRGHDVYVSDAVERGRASFSRWPEIYKSEPVFRDKKEAWEIFRIGVPGSYASNPAMRKANEGQKFPLGAFDTMQMQFVPRWATNGDATQAAYHALVQRVCPCVIMAHGQAGSFAFHAALQSPDKVKALIAIEPAFAPKPGHPNVPQLKDVPHLLVWGDFIDTNPIWVDHVNELKAYHSQLVAAGVNAEWLDLPAAGIKGNTHMIMMDTNSDQIAARVQNWMAGHKLMKDTRSKPIPSATAPIAPAVKERPASLKQKTAVRRRNQA